MKEYERRDAVHKGFFSTFNSHPGRDACLIVTTEPGEFGPDCGHDVNIDLYVFIMSTGTERKISLGTRSTKASAKDVVAYYEREGAFLGTWANALYKTRFCERVMS